jgi:hypothetical protein
MRIKFLSILPLIKLSMISIDYTSYQTKISKSLISQKCNKMKNLIQPDLSTTKTLRYDTIFYPLDMIEDSSKKFINYSLHKSEEGDVLTDDENTYRINGYETKITAFDLNALFFNLIWKQTKYKNIGISIRDYYQKDMSEKLFKSMSLDFGTNVLIMPASLSVVSDFASCDGGEGVYLVVSMVGYQTVFNVYEVSRKNIDEDKSNGGLIEIKTLYSKSCDLLGDSLLDDIVSRNVRMALEKSENKNDEYVLHMLPLENEVEFKESDYFLDIIDICEEIKSKLGYNVEEHSIKDTYIYNTKGIKALLKETKFNLQDIRNEFEDFNTKISENISSIKSEVNEILSKNTISKKFVISSFDLSVVNNILNIENLKNIQEKFIVDGAMKFVYKKIISDDVRIFKDESTYRKTSSDKLLEEINIKKDFIKKINEIKNKKGLNEHLPHIPVKNLPFNRYLVDDIVFIDLKYKECVDFLKLIKKLEDDNYKLEKSIKMRPLQIKKAEDILGKVLKVKDQNIQVWNMGLGKRYEDFKLFLDTNKDNMEILGQDIEFKADMLEGLVESYIRSYENKKKLEEETIKDGDEPIKDGDEPIKDGEEPIKDGEEPIKDGEEPIKDGDEGEKNKGGLEDFSNIDPAEITEMQEKLKNMMKDEKFSEIMKDLEGKLGEKVVANSNDQFKHKDSSKPEEDVKAEKEL